jgi:transposase
LKDKERSGSRPPSVSKEIMVKIRKELEDSNTLGFQAGNGSDIQKRARVRYHEVYIYRLLHKWGFKPNQTKSTTKKVCKYSINKG